MTSIPIRDGAGYVARMAAGLHDKLRVGRFIPPHAQAVLDVGCADGALTLALAEQRPKTTFDGIDLDAGFIAQADDHKRVSGLRNVSFQKVYLRERLAAPQRYDAVIFASVLHEFWTYGEGVSSVLKALADAHELLRPGGVMIVRDMVLDPYARTATWHVAEMVDTIRHSPYATTLDAFEQVWGVTTTLYQLNHFLLKYPYQTNWDREVVEHYVPVDSEQYRQMFGLLGMTMQTHDVYLLPFLRGKWQREIGLADEDLDLFRSTAVFVSQKTDAPRHRSQPRGTDAGD